MSNNLIYLIKQSTSYYSWTQEYARQVAFEYERFLEIRAENEKLSPIDDIDKFWHLHLLNPVLYYNYCLSKFKKIVDHNPSDSFDQIARKQRITNTLIEYRKKFITFAFPCVWKIELENSADLIKIGKDITGSKMTVTIFYTFDIQKGESVYKVWKKTDKKYDGKSFVIDVNKINGVKLSDLRNKISNLTNHQSIGIHFYPAFEKSNVLRGIKKTGFNIPLDSELINIKQDLICVLEEITQHGYC
jgi:hypothetical protein